MARSGAARLDKAIQDSRAALGEWGPLSAVPGAAKSKVGASQKRKRVDDDNRENEEMSKVNMAAVPTGAGWGEDEEARFWKDKFESVRDFATGNKERLVRDLESGEQREDSAVKVVMGLEAKLKQITHSGSSSAQFDAKVDEQRRLLKFYERSVSMTIRLEGEMHSPRGGSDEYVCTVKNALQKKAARFAFVFEGGSNASIKFVPKTNVCHLPAYLQQAIVFESAACPILTADVLRTIFPDEE